MQIPDWQVFIGFGGLVVAAAGLKISDRKWKWTLVCLGALMLIAAICFIFAPKSKDAPITTPTVSATASGTGSTAQAAGHDINNGISPAQLEEVLNLKEVTLSQRILDEYPHGCIILGLEKGKVIYDSRLKDLQFSSDWDSFKLEIDDSKKLATLSFTKFSFSYQNQLPSGFINCKFSFPFYEDHASPVISIHLPGLLMYLEVLDRDKGIFLLGFK